MHAIEYPRPKKKNMRAVTVSLYPKSRMILSPRKGSMKVYCKILIITAKFANNILRLDRSSLYENVKFSSDSLVSCISAVIGINGLSINANIKKPAAQMEKEATYPPTLKINTPASGPKHKPNPAADSKLLIAFSRVLGYRTERIA